MIRDTFLGFLAFAGIVIVGAVFYTSIRLAVPPMSPCERSAVEWPGCMMPR